MSGGRAEPAFAWVDANAILRLLTGEPTARADAAEALVRRAERGEVLLGVCSIVVAEVVWVLDSVYGVDRRRCAQTLLDFFSSDGLRVDEGPILLDALQAVAVTGVDFADAYLVARARLTGSPVASFDRDLDVLEVGCLDPSGEVSSG